MRNLGLIALAAILFMVLFLGVSRRRYHQPASGIVGLALRLSQQFAAAGRAITSSPRSAGFELISYA
ncbi:MAG TPA: hypothetical protein VKZ76_08810 [Edaphocola sp.]|nr:hypothetical protein [Edaphocola sp.]